MAFLIVHLTCDEQAAGRAALAPEARQVNGRRICGVMPAQSQTPQLTNLDQQRHAHDNSGDHVSRFIDVISCCCPLAACCCLSLWTITAAPTASCLTCPLPHTCLLFHSPPRVGHLATSLTSPKSPRSGILTSSHSINQPCCLYACHRHRRRHHVWEVGEKQNPEN